MFLCKVSVWSGVVASNCTKNPADASPMTQMMMPLGISTR